VTATLPKDPCTALTSADTTAAVGKAIASSAANDDGIATRSCQFTLDGSGLVNVGFDYNANAYVAHQDGTLKDAHAVGGVGDGAFLQTDGTLLVKVDAFYLEIRVASLDASTVDTLASAVVARARAHSIV
jgi:hypothetical protein